MIILAAILAAPAIHGLCCGDRLEKANKIKGYLARLARFERATAWFVASATYQAYQAVTPIYFGRNARTIPRICWAGGIVLAATGRGE